MNSLLAPRSACSISCWVIKKVALFIINIVKLKSRHDYRQDSFSK